MGCRCCGIYSRSRLCTNIVTPATSRHQRTALPKSGAATIGLTLWAAQVYGHLCVRRSPAPRPDLPERCFLSVWKRYHYILTFHTACLGYGWVALITPRLLLLTFVRRWGFALIPATNLCPLIISRIAFLMLCSVYSKRIDIDILTIHLFYISIRSVTPIINLPYYIEVSQ